MKAINRRNFIRTSVLGGVAASFIGSSNTFASFNKIESSRIREPFSSSVAITTGENRADMAFLALQPFSKQIKQAIGDRRVVLKPNNVSTSIPLSSTHVDTLEGILEFLRSIKKLDNVIIAESPADGPALDGYSNFGYMRLVNKYPIKLVDLDLEGFEVLYVFDEKDFRPHPVRFSRVLLNPDSYVVSVARMKTHDRVLATLSLKNIVFGAPIKDVGFAWGANHKQGTKSDKAIAHGGGFRGINYNLYNLAPRLHPHLAIIDGFEGMEGNGPTQGAPVDHRVCVASTDWLAADRVAVELMGIDFTKVGYLNYCHQTGLGIADLSRIEIVGENISNHVKPYRLSDNFEKQMIWMTPAS